MSFAPSGRQHEISFGEQRATIVEVGGGIRSYEHGGRDVLEPYTHDAMCDAAHGQPLIPWPNRIQAGRYTFEGVEQQLALSEPERGNAIHGLLRWRPWAAAEHSSSRVVMSAELLPMTGYPFALQLSIVYELSEDGLTVRTSARNDGACRCPFGSGQHPYLAAGEAHTIDECMLELPASTRLVKDPVSQMPISREPVDGTEYDFRSRRSLHGAQLDDGFTDPVRDEQGRATVRFTRADGCTTELWADPSYEFLQVFTGETLPAWRARHALAVEPMTCPPNAFASGEGLLVLEPGQSTTSAWGVALLH